MSDLRVRNCVTSPGIGELQAMTITAINKCCAENRYAEILPTTMLRAQSLLEHLKSRSASKRYYLEFLATAHARGLH